MPVDRERFQDLYAVAAPWDIGKPQPAFEAAADAITGSVLDIGCGTGENALFFASKRHPVTGIDFLEGPITVAKRKAAERGIKATFLVKDALKLQEWSERFDNIIDSGLFHVFPDEERRQYVHGLNTVLNPGGRLLLLCFSDKTPGTEGPRRVTEKELRDAFAKGWEIERLEPARFEVRPEPKNAMFAGQNPHAWFMVARRAL
jgi:ubiquinone/menaquinone biosynthesis C-methylase UbiE